MAVSLWFSHPCARSHLTSPCFNNFLVARPSYDDDVNNVDNVDNVDSVDNADDVDNVDNVDNHLHKYILK